MKPTIRQATVVDIPAIWEVRYAVLENTLTRGHISDEDVRRAIEDTGRGWVVEANGEILAFAIGNGQSGNVWALFVHPKAQGKGYGSFLHSTLIEWFKTQAPSSLWLTTGAQTQACGFYERRGWKYVGIYEPGEVRYERPNPA